jgi:hypothetical protein
MWDERGVNATGGAPSMIALIASSASSIASPT